STFLAVLLITFAGLALVLAVIGTYAVVSHSVSRRTHEIGVRLALGATRARVTRMVVGETMTVAGLALVAGVPAAMASARLLSNYLFEVAPSDPGTIAMASVLMLLSALMGAALPVRRAARVNPVVALRGE
ncbi:MAG TPA: FtsX-like permease family protein, partial [Vicinamibacterales bacterium]|nr:FtsX-like permease family protein [Vicinamibacterales bacterium]